MRLKADLTLFLVAIIWGTAFVAQRVAGQMGSVYLFNGVRYLLAGLVVLPFVGRVGGQAFNLPRAQWSWMFAAGFLLFVAAALQQAGMLYTTAGNAGFITSLYVVFVPILLWFVWRERSGWLAIAAVGLAGVGAFLLSTDGSIQFRAGDVLELIGAFFWTFHVVLLGKFAVKFEPMSFSAGQLIICGVLNLALGAFIEEPVFDWNLLGAVVYTAVFSLGLGYSLQVWGQRHTPPADAALILSLESVFAALSGWLILNELLTPLQAFGCFLIFSAVVLSQIKVWDSGKIEESKGRTHAS
jgi:drug/metabolite transporter (DMT)-like permease